MGEVKLINSKFITKFNDALKMSKYLYDKFFVSSSTIQHCLTLPPLPTQQCAPKVFKRPKCRSQTKTTKKKRIRTHFLIRNISGVGRRAKAP